MGNGGGGCSAYPIDDAFTKYSEGNHRLTDSFQSLPDNGVLHKGQLYKKLRFIILDEKMSDWDRGTTLFLQSVLIPKIKFIIHMKSLWVHLSTKCRTKKSCRECCCKEAPIGNSIVLEWNGYEWEALRVRHSNRCH